VEERPETGSRRPESRNTETPASETPKLSFFMGFMVNPTVFQFQVSAFNFPLFSILPLEEGRKPGGVRLWVSRTSPNLSRFRHDRAFRRTSIYGFDSGAPPAPSGYAQTLCVCPKRLQAFAVFLGPRPHFHKRGMNRAERDRLERSDSPDGGPAGGPEQS